MSENKDNGGPAFPVEVDSTQPEGRQTGNTVWQSYGMSLRDYFAIKSLLAIYSNAMKEANEGSGLFSEPDWRIGLALDSYKMADAMLEARK